MTHSPMSNRPDCMLNIAAKLYNADTDDYKQLSDIFNTLDLRHATPYIHAILTNLHDLLKHGRKIGFIGNQRHSGNQAISTQWSTWSAVIDKALTKYEEITPPNAYSSLIIPTKLPNESQIIKIILHVDPVTPTDNQSSKIQGLKLITLALLMRPDNSTDDLNTQKAIESFTGRISNVNLFKEISLNFTDKIPLMTIAKECEALVNSQYKKHGTYRKFLTTLRNSLTVLNGYHLGTPNERPHTQKNTSDNKLALNRAPKTVRFTPFYCPTGLDEESNIGEMFEIMPEEGEESTIGLITNVDSETTDFEEINEEIASAIAQVKSKQWLQDYHEATPWNSRGINPFTLQILVNWICKNDSTVSLLYGLMICTGRRYEDIMNMTIGDNGDFTVNGEYIRYYTSPDNSFTPTSEQEPLLETLSHTIILQLPKIIGNRFQLRCNVSVDGKSLAEAWEKDTNELKKDLEKTTAHLIREGANGLAIDRIPLTLQKRVATISGDDTIGHILASRANDMPPVSSYYAAYTHETIKSIYKKAVTDLFQ